MSPLARGKRGLWLRGEPGDQGQNDEAPQEDNGQHGHKNYDQVFLPL